MCMGVNRSEIIAGFCDLCCPHVHGGEPIDLVPGPEDPAVVPMCMGVNRNASLSQVDRMFVVPMCMGVNRQRTGGLARP